MSRLNWIVILIAAGLLALIAGCNAAPMETDPGTPTGQATRPASSSAEQISLVRVTQTAAPTPTPEDSTLTLVFWAVEAVSPEAEGEPGDFISNSLRGFERANPNVDVDLLLKKPGGKGGVIEFLRTSKEVAPSVLPDVVIMSAPDLQQAYQLGLIQALDGRLDRSIVQDLLPAARKMGTVDDRLVGVPLGIEMEHIVYNTQVFTNTPITWAEVISSSSTYLLPAKGVSGLVNDATLAQYYSVGGRFVDDEGGLKIDDQALLSVLNFYQRAQENGVIPGEDVLNAAASSELWPLYLQQGGGIVHVNASQYLTDRSLLHNSTFGPVPVQGPEVTPVTITHGWTMVLVSEDVNRQKVALSLIEWFLSTGNNVAWNRINNTIPTRDTAYQELAGDDPYWQFLAEQLNTSQLQPNFTGYDQLGRILQQAVEQVIGGEATAEEAVVTAIDALTK